MKGIAEEQYDDAMRSHIDAQEKEYEERPECCGSKMSFMSNGGTLEWYECKKCGRCVEM